jgi:hypothetical protein
VREPVLAVHLCHDPTLSTGLALSLRASTDRDERQIHSGHCIQCGAGLGFEPPSCFHPLLLIALSNFCPQESACVAHAPGSGRCWFQRAARCPEFGSSCLISRQQWLSTECRHSLCAACSSSPDSVTHAAFTALSRFDSLPSARPAPPHPTLARCSWNACHDRSLPK